MAMGGVFLPYSHDNLEEIFIVIKKSFCYSFNKFIILFKLIRFSGEIRPKIHLCAFIVNLKIIVIGISVDVYKSNNLFKNNRSVKQ